METRGDTSSSQLYCRVDPSTDSFSNQQDNEDDNKQVFVNVVDLLTCQLSRKCCVSTTAAKDIDDQQHFSDDQGIGGSYSSSQDLSSSEEDDEGIVFRIMALDLRKKFRKEDEDDDCCNVDCKSDEDYDCGNVDCKSDVSDDDNTCVALDLTARKPPPPPLTPIPIATSKPNPIKSMTDAERAQLRKGYDRLVRFLRLDAPGKLGLSEAQRSETVRRLQYFLVMYMDKERRSNPSDFIQFMQQSLANDAAIKKFLIGVMSESKQLTRTPSAPSGSARCAASPPMPPPSVLRPAKFATDPDVILARGPGHERPRTSAAHAAPYPQPIRRLDNFGNGGNHHYPYPHGWRTGQQQPGLPPQYLGQHYVAPADYNRQQYGHPHVASQYGHPQHHRQPSGPWPHQPSMYPSYHPLHPPLQTTQSVPNGPIPAFNPDGEINVDELMSCVAKLFPLDGPIEGLELFGPDLPPPERPSVISDLEYLDSMTPITSPPGSSASSSCRTPQPASVISSVGSSPFPESPASPWQLNTLVSLPTSPCSPPQQDKQAHSYHNSVIMSPPLSSTSACSSPLLPGSPMSASVVKKMTHMTLDQQMTQAPKQTPPLRSQPPPLIPLNIPTSPPPVATPPKVLGTATAGPKFPTAREEMLASLNPVLKEQSLRRVAKSPMDAFITPDSDGDTPLMVACANPNIKHEDLYALVEKLKGHPQPPTVFNAMNRKRETALYLAAHEHRPLVAGFLAETMASLKISLNQTYQKGNTLIHEVSMWGDAEVLQYLVRVRTHDNSKPAFDLNAANREGRSALHEAVQQYQPNDSIYGEGFIKIIQLLLNYGADAGLSDKTSGKTPVHIAIEKRDPALLEMLLSKCPLSANAPMYNDNRPLHSAATLSGVTDAQQLELVNILLKYGADKTLRNKANKLPIELVQQDRDKVKSVLQARARQNNFSAF